MYLVSLNPIAPYPAVGLKDAVFCTQRKEVLSLESSGKVRVRLFYSCHLCTQSVLSNFQVNQNQVREQMYVHFTLKF